MNDLDKDTRDLVDWAWKDGIKYFAKKCRNLKPGESTYYHFGNAKINIIRDGKDDSECSDLFDIATFIDGIAVDDEVGVHIDDLEKELDKIVFEKKEFSTL